LRCCIAFKGSALQQTNARSCSCELASDGYASGASANNANIGIDDPATFQVISIN
jgi:hypothetical protein